MPARSPRGRRGVALLLIDFLNPLDFPGAARMRNAAHAAAKRAAALKRKARAAGVSCVYCNDNYGMWDSSFDEVTAAVASKTKDGARLVELLRPEPGDVSILKPRHSGFYGTPLEFLLEDRGVKRLILTGLATDNCVFATAQDAYMRKFEVWVPRDCVAAETRADEPAVLRHMAHTLKARTSRFAGRLWPG